jgi:hypothetical protein
MVVQLQSGEARKCAAQLLLLFAAPKSLAWRGTRWFVGDVANGWSRRVLPLTTCRGEGPFAEPTTAVRRQQREQVNLYAALLQARDLARLPPALTMTAELGDRR